MFLRDANNESTYVPLFLTDRLIGLFRKTFIWKQIMDYYFINCERIKKETVMMINISFSAYLTVDIIF